MLINKSITYKNSIIYTTLAWKHPKRWSSCSGEKSQASLAKRSCTFFTMASCFPCCAAQISSKSSRVKAWKGKEVLAMHWKSICFCWYLKVKLNIPTIKQIQWGTKHLQRFPSHSCLFLTILAVRHSFEKPAFVADSVFY